LLYLTRSLIGQVRKGGGDIEAPFVERMRFPEGPPDEQQQQVFDRLFTAMGQDVPRTVTYGEEGTYQHAGFRCPSREVRVECESGTRYTVRWARFRGNWYIVDCYDSAVGPHRERRGSLLPAAHGSA
jgi:hypothetical protein